jgi:uncharacterized membrane protein
MRTYLATIVAPLLIVVVSLPLIAGWVGRNYFYGFRTPRTLSSDAVWYPANRVAGILLLGAGLVWLAVGLTAGLVAIGAAVLGSVFYLSFLPKTGDRSN